MVKTFLWNFPHKVKKVSSPLFCQVKKSVSKPNKCLVTIFKRVVYRVGCHNFSGFNFTDYIWFIEHNHI